MENEKLQEQTESMADYEAHFDDANPWNVVARYQEEGTNLHVKVEEIVNGGVIAMVEGLRGFIPASRLSLSYIEDLETYLLKEIDVRVIEANQAEGRLILSAREILREQKKAEDAKKLAETMVQIGTMAGKKVAAVITDMDQPLGYAVGNSLEVMEAIDTLQGRGPEDFKQVVFALGGQMLQAAGRADSQEEAEKLMQSVIKDGTALKKFAEFVTAQGGDASYVYETDKFPKASYTKEIPATKEGYVGRILAEEIGIACMTLGGGRETKESSIDLSVGIILKKKNGDFVKEGETIAVVYGNDTVKFERAMEKIQNAYEITAEKPEGRPVVLKYIK